MKHISIVVLSFCLLLNHKAVFAQNPGKVGTANLTAWFKPDGLALGNVSAWTTTFPTGAGAITVSDAVAPYPLATNTPTGAVSNYNTTLEFTGNTLAALKALENTSTTLDLLDNSSAGDEGTFFCVYYKPTTSLNNHMLLYNEGAGAADAIQFRNLGGTGRLAIGKGLGTNVNATRNWTEDFVPTIISYTGNRSGLTTMSAYESSLLMTNSSASQSSGATGLYMGVMPGNGNSPYNGYLSEYIFYNRDLTTAELEKVHSYLAIKYGITLDIGASISPQGNYVSSFGTLVWNATNAPLYHNDVIGIARDDSTGLLQKQSHAFNYSYRLYLDVLQPTNIANLGVFNTDTSFVIMGHNTGVSCATAAANAEVPAVPVLFSRIEREWKVSKTNFSQAFSCDFVLDPCATQSNFEYNCMRLLVDDDGDFTNAIVFDETSGLNFSYNAGVVSVSGISNLHIPDNATRYITLGSVNIPTANLGNDTILCAGQNLLLDVTTPAATYLWQDNSTNPTYLVTMPGTYWVEVSNGVCTITDTIVVSDLSFVVDLGNDTTICQADSLLLDATIMNGTYLWQNNSTDSAIYASQSGIYWVETTVSGCVERDSINISVNPSPIFNLGNDTILCENDVLTLDATVSSATYLWHDNSINPTFNVTQAGTFWAIATLNNCVFEDSISITYQIINVDLGVDTVLCQGEVITLDASQSGASYLWQDNDISPTYTISQAGTYWVDVTINNCVERDSIIVSYNPLPTPNLGNDTTLCEFESLLLDVTEPNAAYLWHDNSTNASFNITSAGIYWVESTINNCSFRDSISVSYTQLPVVNLGADQVLCEGAGFILDATNAGASYLWQDNSVGPMFQGATAGQYYVAVTRGNCTVSDTINISYYAPVDLQFSDFPKICVGDYHVFSHSIDAADINSSTWTFGNGQISNAFNPSIQFNQSGTIGVNLEIVTINGCVYNFSSNIDVEENPIANFSYEPDKPLKGTEVSLTDLSTGAVSYLWDFGNGFDSNDPSPTASYPKAGNYQITQIVFSETCSDTIIKTILISDELIFYVPNIFTPGEGTSNLEFQPVFTSGIDPYQYHLMIFNRNGEIIFESFNAEKGWDGNYGNTPVQNGAYVWQIRFKETLSSESTYVRGYVTVLR